MYFFPQISDSTAEKHGFESKIQSLEAEVTRCTDQIKADKEASTKDKEEFTARESKLESEIKELTRDVEIARAETELQKGVTANKTNGDTERLEKAEKELSAAKKELSTVKDERDLASQEKEDISQKRNSEIKLLRSKVADLEEKVENEQTGRQLTEAREEVTSLKKDRTRLSERVEFFEGDTDVQKGRITDLERQLSRKGDEVMRANNERDVCKKLVTDLQQERAKILTEASQKEKSGTEEYEARVRKLTEEMNLLETDKTEVEVDKEKLLRRVEKAEKEQREAETAKKDLESHRDSLQLEIERVKSERETLGVESSRLGEKLERITREKASQESSLAAGSGAAAALEEKNGELTRQIDDLRREKRDLQDEKDKTDDEVARVKRDLDRVKRENEDKSAELSTVEKTLTEQKRLNQNRISDLSAREESLEGELRASRARVTALQQENSDLMSKSVMGDSELKTKLDQNRVRIAELEEASSAATGTLDRLRSQHKSEVMQLKDELEVERESGRRGMIQERERSTKTRADLETAEKSVARLEASLRQRSMEEAVSPGEKEEYKRQQAEIDSLRSKLNNEREAARVLRTEKERMESQVASLRAKNDRLNDTMEQSRMDLVRDVSGQNLDWKMHSFVTIDFHSDAVLTPIFSLQTDLGGAKDRKSSPERDEKRSSSRQKQPKERSSKSSPKRDVDVGDVRGDGLSELDLLSEHSALESPGDIANNLDAGFAGSSGGHATYQETIQAVNSLRRIERAKALVQQRSNTLRNVRAALQNDRSQWQRDWTNVDSKKSSEKEVEILRSMRKVLDRRAAQLNSDMKKVKSAGQRLQKQEQKGDRYMKQLLGGSAPSSAGLGLGFGSNKGYYGGGLGVNGMGGGFIPPSRRAGLGTSRRGGGGRDFDLNDALHATDDDLDLDAGPAFEIPRSFGLTPPMAMPMPMNVWPSMYAMKGNMYSTSVGDRGLLDQWLQILRSKCLTDQDSEKLRIDEERFKVLSANSNSAMGAGAMGAGGGGGYGASSTGYTVSGDLNRTLAVHLSGFTSQRNQLRSALNSHVDWMRGVASEVNERLRK